MVVGRLLSYWEGNFSGATLNFGRVFDKDLNPPNQPNPGALSGRTQAEAPTGEWYQSSGERSRGPGSAGINGDRDQWVISSIHAGWLGVYPPWN